MWDKATELPQTAGRRAGAGDTTAGGGDAASMGGSTLSSEGVQTNNAGDSHCHCYCCGGKGHWANECPELAEEQKAQLHMTVKGSKEEEQGAQTAHQFSTQASSKERDCQTCEYTSMGAQQWWHSRARNTYRTSALWFVESRSTVVQGI